MKRNRRVSQKKSVAVVNTLRFGSFFVVFAMMVILDLMASSSCSNLTKAKGAKEREIKRLEGRISQEQSRWESMTTPENMERVLLRRGMSMQAPQAWQVIRVNEDGSVPLGQLSVKVVQQRGEGRNRAQVVRRGRAKMVN